MKTNRRQFVEVLEKLSPSLGTNVFMPEFQYFQVEGDHIQTFDGVMIADSVSLLDTGLACSIPKGVLGLLSSLDTEEVDLAVKDGELQVKTNKLEGKFSVVTPPKFQPLTSMDTKDMKLVNPKLVDDVVAGLGFCRFGVSKDAAAGPLCGVQINKDTIFSSDRYRVVKWNLDGNTEITCSVPLKFADLLKKNQDKISKLGCMKNETFIAILDDGTYISTCLLQGQYPDLLKYFPDSMNYEQVEFGSSLPPVVDRHLVLLQDMNPLDRVMIIEIKQGICTLTSKVPEKSNLVEQIDVVMGGDSEIGFSVNPTFLKEILSKCSNFKYFDDTQDSNKGLILFETDKLQYLMRAGVL